LGKSSLLLVETVEEIRTQFECYGHVQQVSGARAKFGCNLSRQLAGAFKERLLQTPELEDPVAQIPLEVGCRLSGLRGRNLFPKDPQREDIDDFEFPKRSNKAFSGRSLHRADGSGPIGIRAVQ